MGADKVKVLFRGLIEIYLCNYSLILQFLYTQTKKKRLRWKLLYMCYPVVLLREVRIHI